MHGVKYQRVFSHYSRMHLTQMQFILHELSFTCFLKLIFLYFKKWTYAGGWFGIVATVLVTSTQLRYVEPG